MVSAQPQRAQRFAIPISMLYREAGTAYWQEGQTENISRSGVLFRAKRPIDVDTTLGMLMEIPAEVAGTDAGLTMCTARAVRTIAETNEGSRPCVAAAIVDCERLPYDPRRI